MKQLFIIATMVLLLSACGGDKKEESKAAAPAINGNTVSLTDAQLQNAGIQTGKLEALSLSSVLKVSGKIDVPPQNMVSISVPLGGYLKSTKLLPGTHVSKGEVLAVIEDQQYIQIQQDYLTAKSQFSYHESEYNRQKELNQSKATSDKAFEQTKAAYLSQNVLLKALEEKLKLIGVNPYRITANTISRSINIYSPIAGYVSAVNVNIGKYVTPSDVLFELVNPTDIHLALTVFEKDVDKLLIGQKLLAFTNTQPDKKYPCKILLISKNLSNERSAMVHCHFEQYDKSLLPGMFMNAEIEVKNDQVKALPDDAIVRFENKFYVFITKGKKQFEMVEVKAGTSEKGFTEVTIDAKRENETFVTKGAYNLLMKLKNKAEE